jgi:hypothetical protein
MGSATGKLSELMRYRTNVASCGDMHRKGDLVSFQREKLKVVYGDARRFYRNLRAGASQLMSRNALDLLSGIDRGNLIHLTAKGFRQLAELVE